jgi:hypothetical protein
MANIKATSTNIEQIITDMVNDIATSRTDQFYFVSNELNENTIRQIAWDRNIIVNVVSVNGYNNKFSFLEILN